MPKPVHQLIAGDVALMASVCTMFGEAFNDMDMYTSKRPSAAYLQSLLARDTFFALAALDGDQLAGALVAYEMIKFEQERSEIYIYDLAVAAPYRRQGIATALIEALQAIAAKRGAYVIFVQADTAEEDQPAIALYEKLGVREQVLHFDIPVGPAGFPGGARSAA